MLLLLEAKARLLKLEDSRIHKAVLAIVSSDAPKLVANQACTVVLKPFLEVGFGALLWLRQGGLLDYTGVAFAFLLYSSCCDVLLAQPQQRLFELRDLELGVLLNLVVEDALTAAGRHQACAQVHQLLRQVVLYLLIQR